jgi:hypothetical protein
MSSCEYMYYSLKPTFSVDDDDEGKKVLTALCALHQVEFRAGDN